MSDKDTEIITAAKTRFKRCEDFEATFRNLFVDDLRFCNADSDNMYQWPDQLRRNRDIDARPSLTINKTRQHALMIQNEIKQNLPAIKISPTGGEASYDSAQVLAGICRAIEYNSNAEDAYDTAMMHQVQGGIGYWRVTTDYADTDSFDQEIFIRRIKDPMSVYLDPDCLEADGSDAKFGFLFRDYTRDEFKLKYPKHADMAGRTVMGQSTPWCNRDQIRVAEYFYLEHKKDVLIALPQKGTDDQPIPGQYDTLLLSTITDKTLRDALKADDSIRNRPVQTPEWRWCLIAGDEIIDRNVWPGKFIPIVRVVGEEMVIDGVLDRKGHVRNLKDPQRMYNYWTSSAVEQVALQGKQPYMAGVQAIAGFEDYYKNANRLNYSYLPYNAIDEQGNPISAPQRETPPQMAPAYINGMQIAAEEMKMVSGQQDPTMGAQANEIAGVAIQKRIKQGDKATFHYADNLAKAIRYTGKIIIDLVPKIYDTPRVVRILAEDGSDEQISIDPSQQQPLVTQEEDKAEASARRIFNPLVGKYDVVAQAGPTYATKREEAAASMAQMAIQNPEFLSIAGDIFFGNQDFPGAEQLSERYRNTIPANILGEGPSPEMQALQQQLEQANQAVEAGQAQLASALQAMADSQKKQENDARKTDIDNYKAITDRLDKLMTHMGTVLPDGAMVQQQTMEAAAADPIPAQEAQQFAQPQLSPQGMI